MARVTGQTCGQAEEGQSTLEYILVLAVVLLAIIAFASGALRSNVQKTLNESGTTIDKAGNKFIDTNAGVKFNF